MSGSQEDLRAEYLLLQGIYEDYDKRALSLKAMATPLLGAGLAVGLSGGTKIWILVATISMAASLWLLEAIWKTFQYCHRSRLWELEHWFRYPTASDSPAPFQIFSSWNKEWVRRYRNPFSWAPILLEPFNFLPYAVIVIIGSVGLMIAAPDRSTGRDQAQEPPSAQNGTASRSDRPAPADQVSAERREQLRREQPAARRVSQASDAASDRSILPAWLWMMLMLLAAGAGFWLVLLRRGRPEPARYPGGTEMATDRVNGPIAAAGISLFMAAAAFATAFAAVTKVGEPWPLALPLLITPLSVVAATAFPPRFRRFVFWASLLASLILACAFLIPASAAWPPWFWPAALWHNLLALIGRMKASDIAALVAALMSYLVALFGSASVAKR